MADWDKLTQGLALFDRDGDLPLDLVDRLDLVYSLGNENGQTYPYRGIDLQHSFQQTEGIVTEIRKILTPKSSFLKVIVGDSPETERAEIFRKSRADERTLDRLFVFGAVLNPGFADYAAVPVFCIDKKPEGIDMEEFNCVRFRGLYPVGLSEGFIKINKNEWAGAIDVNYDGKASVYFGNATTPSETEAVIFDEPVRFDLEKRLVLARSPNGSIEFEGLHTLNLSEGSRDADYALVWDKVENLLEGKTWVVNSGASLNWKNNPFLDLYTRD